jgi:hypothetical protein
MLCGSQTFWIILRKKRAEYAQKVNTKMVLCAVDYWISVRGLIDGWRGEMDDGFEIEQPQTLWSDIDKIVEKRRWK